MTYSEYVTIRTNGLISIEDFEGKYESYAKEIHGGLL
jgi:hypothetical protein